MRKARKSQARQRAMALLEQHAVREPPVDVQALAARCGIEVKIEAMGDEGDDLSGMLLRDGKTTVIAVNSQHHPNRRRFTLAHELGHYCLHPDERVHVDARRLRVQFRDKRSSTATDPKEIEANAFAAALLMPDHWLRGDADRFAGLDEGAIEELAHRYRVSTHAMTLRLINLRLLQPDAVDL